MAVTDGVMIAQDGAVLEIVLKHRADGTWLDRSQRADVLAALAQAGPGTGAVLIRSERRHLVASPDADPDMPFFDDTATPGLDVLCRAIEACPVPVVVVLEGQACGLGAELALAAAARVATPDAHLAFSAARVGRISGAGATQRLPRLVGPTEALTLLSGGHEVNAPEALAMGLVDQIIEGETPDAIRHAAIRWAVSDAMPKRPRAPGLRDPRGYLAITAAARAGVAAGNLQAALVDCIEAALLLPHDQGLALEASLSGEFAQRPEAAALLHVHRAEMAAGRTPPALTKLSPAPVANPAFLAPARGHAGLIVAMLSRGLPVLLAEPDRAKLVAVLHAVAARQEAAVQAGHLRADQRDADWARLIPVSDADVLAQADLVIAGPDARPPAPRRKVPVLITGRGALPEGAFRLVLTGRVAELGLPPASPAQHAAQAMAFLRRLGLTLVLTGTQSPVGIAGRLAGAGGAALRALLGLGVPPEDIAAAVVGLGLAAPNLPTLEVAPPPRAMSREEIASRWLAALANEGARVLASGLAVSSGDVDLVAIHGLGFPRASGGPMHIADQRGLMILRRDLRLWAVEDPVWTPVPALDAFVSVGRGFAGSLSRG
ncbi:MAG: enoyl-CoA hydratase/isomerase family protein [Rhodobacteraceae bacterium]|nr:enoyl-CoA hydratase/isomerase family protein [Paracoccaceae bacterium]